MALASLGSAASAQQTKVAIGISGWTGVVKTTPAFAALKAELTESVRAEVRQAQQQAQQR
jgi:hypothetical protein